MADSLGDLGELVLDQTLVLSVLRGQQSNLIIGDALVLLIRSYS
jgi:hypothetical protein